MAEGRPDVPAPIRRAVLVEAGHRCAVPTCRQWPVEICHIEDWAKVKEHRFENLVALCPTCHTRQTAGDIDRTALRAYKHNLGLMNSRYSAYEQRVLRFFAEDTERRFMSASGGDDQTIQLQNLLTDGFLEEQEVVGMEHVLSSQDDSDSFSLRVPGVRLFGITDSGRAYIKRWLGPEGLD